MRGRKISGLSAEWVSFLEGQGGIAAFARAHKTSPTVVKAYATGKTLDKRVRSEFRGVEGLPAPVAPESAE